MSIAKCPVDHASIEGSPSSSASPAAGCPIDHSQNTKNHVDLAPVTNRDSGEDAAVARCPVDHSAIDAANHPFFQQHHAKHAAGGASGAKPAAAAATASARQPGAVIQPHSSDTIVGTDHFDFGTNPLPEDARLPRDREVSSILRGGEDAADGERWVYPSQHMFFHAMKRKNWDPKEQDMAVVVPIHNAVNEMAWKKILEWEKLEAEPCGLPKLTRFQGRPGDLTPRAWVRSRLLGYTPPFDRHDWTVDRCGGARVSYVIDFYTGRADAQQRAAGAAVAFHLDVRPKLDSWEGVRLRARRWWADLFQ